MHRSCKLILKDDKKIKMDKNGCCSPHKNTIIQNGRINVLYRVCNIADGYMAFNL